MTAGNCAGTRSMATMALRDFLLQNKGNFSETQDFLLMGGGHVLILRTDHVLQPLQPDPHVHFRAARPSFAGLTQGLTCARVRCRLQRILV
jgi:hypothetical protein